MSEKICPNCGTVIYDGDFCFECGTKLDVEDNGFFSKVDEKTRLSTLIFSFIILGVFLFIGSFFWGIFTSNGMINFSMNVLLTVVFAVFFGGLFLGYTSCANDSYVAPNFILYFGSIVAAILCSFGALFAVTMAFSTALSSVFSSSPLTSSYGNSLSSSTGSNGVSSLISNFTVDIIIILLLIPAASYLGIYLGFIIKSKFN